MIFLKCQNCKHKWNYKGKKEYYTCCPNCYYKVNLKKQSITHPNTDKALKRQIKGKL